MNTLDTLKLALDAGAYIDPDELEVYLLPQERFERFAALIAAQEREACAKVCENLPKPTEPTTLTHLPTLRTCAAAIRARGEK